MIRSVRSWLIAAMLAALGAPLLAATQDIRIDLDPFDRPSVRVLQDYTLRAGDTARRVVVIGGDARIEGTVSEDVVVVLGKVDLASTAVIEGSLATVAGTVSIADGAKVAGDFVVVGGADTPSTFQPGGQHVVIGTTGMGERLRGLLPWLTSGLLLARPIVPWLNWVWLVAGIFFFINFLLNLLFDAPVRACALTLRETPFSAFIAGLLVMLLFGPVCVLLAVSVIGIAVIPFVLCAIVAAAILGRIGFARWLGMSLVAQADPADRGASVRSFVIGSALMCIAYMIPVLGFMVWVLAGVFGLGSATLAFYAKYRRENPRPPKKVRVPPVPPADVTAVPPMVAPPVMQTATPFEARASDVAAEPPATPYEGPAVAYEAPAIADEPSAVEPGGYPKAMFIDRLGALALDTIVVFILVQMLEIDRMYANERWTILLALAYHVGFWTWRGTTLGGMICRLRVVRTDGKPLEFAESLVRGITGILSLAVAGLGFLWILRDPERQAWHDRVAGTYVVKLAT